LVAEVEVAAVRQVVAVAEVEAPVVIEQLQVSQ
jgi:hypothetical protein